jgi:hypothetical protein
MIDEPAIYRGIRQLCHCDIQIGSLAHCRIAALGRGLWPDRRLSRGGTAWLRDAESPDAANATITQSEWRNGAMAESPDKSPDHQSSIVNG